MKLDVSKACEIELTETIFAKDDLDCAIIVKDLKLFFLNP